jgi:DNA topoisomerase-1
MITAGLGRYGPYVRLGNTYRSLEQGDDVLSVGLNRAVALLAEAPKRRGGEARELGSHPADDKPVTQGKGRYGPYVKHGRLFATIPRDQDPAEITLEEAVVLLTAQAGKKKKKTGGARKARKA